MPGEKVLLIDSSVAVLEIGRAALEDAGFRVAIGANGIAALTAPDLTEYDAIVLDVATEGIDGFLTTRQLKTDARTYRIPILLLVPEEEAVARGSQPLRGADGFIVKPFNPTALVTNVRALLEEHKIEERAEEYLRQAADSFMEHVAEEHIRGAVEHKTQIIVERAIQNVISELDSRVGHEVNERMRGLTAEREQELVRATVHEVAQSMVEKLAERKVSEAIESLLAEMTEKTVKKSAESAIPALARKQIKESLEHLLPREIQTQVQRSMEAIVPDVSKKIVLMIDGIAQKIVPKAAREKLPELCERHVKLCTDKAVPELVRELVGVEISRQLNDFVQPAIRDAATKVNRRTTLMTVIFFVLFIAATAGIVFWSYYFSSGGA